MPPWTERAREWVSPRAVTLATLLLAGYALTLLVFYPGIMTYDAKSVYADIAKGTLGDWQSPVMTVLWAWIDPVARGPGSMFLLIATSYWLAFGLLTFAVARASLPLAILLPFLALLPPAFVFVGVIWRDVLFATTWLLAAAIAFAAAPSAYSRASGNPDLGPRFRGDERGRELLWRLPLQALALALCAFGVLLRPNALVAAPILAAFILWPARFYWKRTAILFLPAMAALFALVQFVYYGALGATRQHPLHSIMVFDLGGISHFTKQNQFPVAFSEPETRLLLDGCYKPTMWDLYWRLEPCEFVMNKVEKEEKLFGTPALTNAWVRAVTRHPIAYVQHRAAFMANFLFGSNLTMWTADIEDPAKPLFPGRAAFGALMTVHDAVQPTPLFRMGAWLAVCIAACGFGWRKRDTPAGAFAIGVCGSAAVYVATFFAVGVASDFRYGYWAVLAGIAGAVVAGLGPPRPRPA